MKQIIKRVLLVLVVGFINVFADRITKLLAEYILKGKDAIGLVNNYIILCYAENTGAFLSLGTNWPIIIKYIVLLIIPIFVCVFVVVYCVIKEKSKPKVILLSTIVAGGLCNLFDRVFNNFSVIDFLNFGVGNFRTGILNVADLSVTFGIVALVLNEVLKMKKINNKFHVKES